MNGFIAMMKDYVKGSEEVTYWGRVLKDRSVISLDALSPGGDFRHTRQTAARRFARGHINYCLTLVSHKGNVKSTKCQ